MLVFQVMEYGAVVSSVPKVFPSSKNRTPTTPTVSEAVALTAMALEIVLPSVGAESDTVGGVVSGILLTVTEKGVDVV